MYYRKNHSLALQYNLAIEASKQSYQDQLYTKKLYHIDMVSLEFGYNESIDRIPDHLCTCVWAVIDNKDTMLTEYLQLYN